MASIVAIGPNPALRVRMQLRGLEDDQVRDAARQALTEGDTTLRREALAELARRGLTVEDRPIDPGRILAGMLATLTPAQRRVFNQLERQPAPARQLATDLKLSVTTVETYLDVLFRRGLVTRTGRPYTYEVVTVKPEPAGEILTPEERAAWLASDATPEPEEPSMAATAEPKAPTLRQRILDALVKRGPMTAPQIAGEVNAPITSITPTLTQLVDANHLARRGSGGRGQVYTYHLPGDEPEVDEDAGEPDPDADLEVAPQEPEVTPKTPEIPAAPAPAPHVESSAPAVAPTILEDPELTILARCSRALEELRALDEDAQHRARRYLLDRHFDLGARPA